MRTIILTLLLLVGICCQAQTGVTVGGHIVDALSGKGLPNVTVSIRDTHIGTVSNSDGYFTLYSPTASDAEVLFSTLGYATASRPLDKLTQEGNVIKLNRRSVELGEVVVYGGDASSIIEEAIQKIADNYPGRMEMLSLFYRETIRKGRRFIGVSEAAIVARKSSYSRRDTDADRVRIDRGRRIVSQRNSDTLAVKIVGGPNLAIAADFVKNADMLFAGPDLGDYSFRLERSEYLDDRPQYVISFRPVVRRDFPQFQGTVYVDRELLAFTRAEFEMLSDNKALMTEAILLKKPRGLRFNPLKIGFTVSYRTVDGRTYLNYISNETRFKCEMKRKLFASAYTTYAEMVVVDRDESPSSSISYRSSFKPHQIFYDVVEEYWDEDFWSDYNIIEPTESLETAVDKLKRTGVASPL